jgi:hypothetical protein
MFVGAFRMDLVDDAVATHHDNAVNKVLQFVGILGNQRDTSPSVAGLKYPVMCFLT